MSEQEKEFETEKQRLQIVERVFNCTVGIAFLGTLCYVLHKAII